MKRITTTFERARANGQKPVVSFEIFPPRGDLTSDAARETVGKLAGLYPDYISVTYSAAGSGNGSNTAEMAGILQDEFDITTMAHLTCVNATRESILAVCNDLRSKGIENVLALRGDLPKGQAEPEGDFRRATDLIELLKDQGFCVGAACYPEGHPDVFDEATNITHLRAKQDAGADFFVTQLFYDNQVFYRFLDQARNAGVDKPITAGVMPFMSKAQVQRMVFMCGVSLPSAIVKILNKYENDREALREAGIRSAANQLVDLSRHEVDGLHLYTMNKPDVAITCMEALRADWRLAE